MKSILTLIFVIVTVCTMAQNNVGIGTSSPAAGAALDITANGKGVLVPRMAFIDRPSSPVTGLMIYQTDSLPGFYYYDGTAWERITANEKNRNAETQSAAVNTITDGASLSFLSAIDTVQISKPGQKIFVTAISAFGTTIAAGANNLEIFPACQAIQAGSTIQTGGLGFSGIRCSQNQRRTETVTYIFSGLPVGSYRVGMAGHSTVVGSAVNWNNNGASYVSTFILD